MAPDDLQGFPILGPRDRGTRRDVELTLPGPALAQDRWNVTVITGSQPGPAVLVNAGVHGGEYPAIQTVIELAQVLSPETIRGTIVLLPVLNVQAFWERSMFVCPADSKNLNRQFPGDPDGTYSQQLAHAFMTEFILQADAHLDLHGGDIVEALVPFAICQREDNEASRKAFAIARVFGLPYLLVVERPVQPGGGTTTCAAAVKAGIPSIVVEASGIGQLEWESVALLRDGAMRVLAHLGNIEDGPEPAPEPVVLSSFDWLYSPVAGMFYSTVAVGDVVNAGQVVGTVGTFTGSQIAEIRSPVEGRVLFLTTSPAMKENGLVMGIGVV